MEKINTEKEKGGIYRLENINQVLTKANELFAKAKSKILVSASKIPDLVTDQLLQNLKKTKH